jgi:uncharacterized Zn-binding protein involved in type VI secretion
MGDFLLNVGATGMCPHAGPLQIVPGQVKVLLGGQPAATASDQFLITGCPFTVPPAKPQPCVTAKFIPAVKVLLSGNPAVLKGGGVICQSAEQIPQGPPTITVTQLKVTGT